MSRMPVLVMGTVLAVTLVTACGGGTVATRSPSQATSPASVATPTVAATQIAGSVSAEQLCGLLTPEDWQQFNYVTGAEPDITPQEGGAICQFANGLALEVYVDENDTDAEATYQTILENVPFEDAQDVSLPGADKASFDPDIGDDNAGMAFQAGNNSYLITVLAREEALAELTTLAGLVLTRAAALP